MSKIISKTFLWMFLGLLVTFLTGFFVSTNENMINAIFNGSLYWIFIILELVIVIYFSSRVAKMKPTAARMSFLLYSFISGLTFSSIFLVFELSSVMYVFLIAAVLFGIFGLIGYKTKYDLTKLGSFLFMGLIGVIICTIINIFLRNSTFDLIVSIITLIIFLGYTAFDIKRLKTLNDMNVDSDIIAINGAFELYLDFINIFIHLLSIIGDAKD